MSRPEHRPDEPTRDEIREACEAVGWEWRSDLGAENVPGHEDQFVFPVWSHPRSGTADAMILLEAWRLAQEDGELAGRAEYGIERGLDSDGRLVYAVTLRRRLPQSLIPKTLTRCDEPTLLAAAVRAVNARSKLTGGLRP